MRARFFKPVLFVLLGIFIGMYFLRCGNDAGIGSEFDETQYYTKDEIDALFASFDDEVESLLNSVSDVAMDVTTGKIPAEYEGGPIRKLYLKDLGNIQAYVKLKTGKTTISINDLNDHIRWMHLEVATYDDEDPWTANFQFYRFSRITGDPAEDGTGIYWPVRITDINDSEDFVDNHKLIQVNAVLM